MATVNALPQNDLFFCFLTACISAGSDGVRTGHFLVSPVWPNKIN